MKKTGRTVILVFMTILCACVFPFCLIREETNIDPTLGLMYACTPEGGRELTQTFTARGGYLSEMAFDIAFPDGEAWEGNLIFRIREEDGKGRLLVEEIIPAVSVNDWAYTYVQVGRRLKKGALYSYTLSVEEGTQGEFHAIYTEAEADAVPGNRELYFEGMLIEGQAVTRYVYMLPLDFKNVLFLWSFIWMIGLMLMEAAEGGRGIPGGNRMAALEGLLVKWQFPILFLELAVLLGMVVRLCGNEAVHWDEAYTWRMVTKNNFAQMLQATAADVHPPLYYLLVQAAMGLLGEDIFVAKLVSVAGAAATGVLGITLVRKRFGLKTAMGGLLVAELGPQMIFYNVDVRMYSWVVFFVIAAGLFAYEIMLSDKTVWWMAFVLVSLGGVYTQYFSVVPLALLYLLLLCWVMTQHRDRLWKWAVCCVATIAGYLPWLSVVVDTLRRDAAGERGEVAPVGIGKMCQWAFQSDLKYSEYLPGVLFLTALFCVAVEYKRFTKPKRVFLCFSGAMLFAAYGICMLLASQMSHFWENRYLVDALLFLWLFLLALLAEKSLAAWSAGMVWLALFVSSSYSIVEAKEFNTIPWILQARELLGQVEGEEKIVYTFPTYDVLYSYYVPGAEFIWYEDVDFSNWKEEVFYVIAWGENDFPEEIYVSGDLKKEVLGEMRLEEGASAQLWRMWYRPAEHETIK